MLKEYKSLIVFAEVDECGQLESKRYLNMRSGRTLDHFPKERQIRKQTASRKGYYTVQY